MVNPASQDAPPAEVFATDRLIVRPWTHSPGDLDRIFDIYSRWEVSRWLGAVPQAMDSREQAAHAVDRWAGRTDDRWGLGVWAVQVRATGVVAGTVLLVTLPEPTPGLQATATAAHADVEVGWHFHPDSWGNGYATEAAAGALSRGFSAGLEAVYAVVRPDNEASAAVCRRLGMAHLGRTSRWYGTELDAFRTTPTS